MLRKNAMAKSISENNSRDLWKEVHVYKVRSKCKTSSQCMDDVSGNESISELFAHKYNVLYNSVCSNTTQLNELLALNENDIITNCFNNNTSLLINILIMYQLINYRMLFTSLNLLNQIVQTSYFPTILLTALCVFLH